MADIEKNRIANAASSEEIEITHEMIMAGADELRLYDCKEDSAAVYAEFIFRAMDRARLRNSSQRG